MYKSTHNYIQQKADGHNPFKLAQGDEVLTDAQKRDVLKSKLVAIEKRIAELPANHSARSQLVREKHVVETMLSELKEFRDKNGIEKFFIQAAKEILSVGQFNLVMAEALKMLKRYKEIEYETPPAKDFSSTANSVKVDLEQATREFIAKGGSITKVPSKSDRTPMMNVDPRVTALTAAQHKIFKKLRTCGICKEDALREAMKP